MSENETGAFKNYESREEWAYQKIGSLLLKASRNEESCNAYSGTKEKKNEKIQEKIGTLLEDQSSRSIRLWNGDQRTKQESSRDSLSHLWSSLSNGKDSKNQGRDEGWSISTGATLR